MKVYLKKLLLCILVFSSWSALAGSRGYNVLWINLEGAGHVATKEIRAYIKNPPQHRNCLLIFNELGGNLYSRIRPPGVTDALVKKMLQGDLASELELKKLMRSFEDDRVSGFDGMFIYYEDQKSRYLTVISPGKGKSKTSSENIKIPLTNIILREMICGAIDSVENDFYP